MSGNPCCERSFVPISWTVFLSQTNSALGGNELCDCWRQSWIENRRYHNPEINTTIVFAWYGRAPIYMRKGFTTFPPQKLCELNGTNCPSDIRTPFDEVTIGQIMSNLTIAFKPNILIINWGHHHTYYSKTRGGDAVHQNLMDSFKRIQEAGINSTRFLFKTTTPFCKKEIKHYQTNRVVHCEPDNSDPHEYGLLASQLVREKYFELYNVHEQIMYLYSKSPMSPQLITNQTSYYDSYPIYWDALHPNCWVMKELNRVLIATYFTSSKWVP